MQPLLQKLLYNPKNAPSLSFNFIDGSAFSPQITFTRASTATYFDSAGVLQSAAIDAPRFDFNPSTLAARGLLIEEARTNSIRNNTMVGAVAGTPGTLPTNWGATSIGLTREIVGTGTENGITYIDVRFSGTTTGQFGNIRFEPDNNVAASSGQSWAVSAYLRLVAGSFTNIATAGVVLYSFTSAPAFISSTQTTAAIGATLTRFSHVGTMPATTGFVQPAVFFTTTGASGQAVDFTLRIGLPQLELGAFATSVIPTTTTALTRAADVANVNTLSPWFNSASGTIYGEFSVPQLGGDGRIATVDDGSTNNQIDLTVNIANGAFIEAVAAGVYGGNATAAGTITANTTQKLAGTYSTSANETICLNGGSVGSNNVTLPSVALTRLLLGRQEGSTFLNGYLRRVTYYPRALSSAELQTLTT